MLPVVRYAAYVSILTKLLRIMKYDNYYLEYQGLKKRIVKDILKQLSTGHKGHFEFGAITIMVDIQPRHYDEVQRFKVVAINSDLSSDRGLFVEDIYSHDMPLEVGYSDFDVIDLLYILEQI
jgi:hypothetical protein